MQSHAAAIAGMTRKERIFKPALLKAAAQARKQARHAMIANGDPRYTAVCEMLKLPKSRAACGVGCSPSFGGSMGWFCTFHYFQERLSLSEHFIEGEDNNIGAKGVSE